MYTYNEAFYRYINQGSLASAEVVVPTLLQVLPLRVTTVLDVGCGAGAWLSVWKKAGVSVTGLDGAYVQSASLLIDPDEFRARDLTADFDLGERFDIAQSLEVAEHLPAEFAAGFVENLCRSADVVLFSAAAPGQGGENHVNEQPYSYWQALFESRGYAMYDALRHHILEDKSVMPWYRFNTFVYVRRDVLPQVHDALANDLVPPGTVPPDKSPRLYQWRKRLIRALPVRQRTQIAVAKKRLQNSWRRSSAADERAAGKEHPPG